MTQILLFYLIYLRKVCDEIRNYQRNVKKKSDHPVQYLGVCMGQMKQSLVKKKSSLDQRIPLQQITASCLSTTSSNGRPDGSVEHFMDSVSLERRAFQEFRCPRFARHFVALGERDRNLTLFL